ncbi:hypothetical protein BC834DRAFT_858640 [Gloeopeniophorella convolvens]|nr:hypothetical protein BC834DRAFT_858640 [Gloeopeniophorella convolvens]
MRTGARRLLGLGLLLADGVPSASSRTSLGNQRFSAAATPEFVPKRTQMPHILLASSSFCPPWHDETTLLTPSMLVSAKRPLSRVRSARKRVLEKGRVRDKMLPRVRLGRQARTPISGLYGPELFNHCLPRLQPDLSTTVPAAC